MDTPSIREIAQGLPTITNVAPATLVALTTLGAEAKTEEPEGEAEEEEEATLMPAPDLRPQLNG